ncbi:MAG: C39 family peptidase [Candidatus Wallbacteria bacterium]|nr:C39 family peptidase [Candidatus Wallbacteria bacterium]
MSWNARTPSGAKLRLEARVGREGSWSPWYRLATWTGDAPGAPVPWQLPSWAEPRGGGVELDTDTLCVRAPGASRLQCRIAFFASRSGPRPRVRTLMAALTAGAKSPVSTATESPSTAPAPQVALEVPYRSQRWERPELASRICCPTSLSMALSYFGVDRPTEEIALRCYDGAHDVFGNWPYAAAAAAELGFDARVTRLRDWQAVRRLLERGLPVIISVSFKGGELDGSPMQNGTAGHLILVRGLTGDGRVLVNDPAGHREADGRTAYRADQLLAAWRNGAAIVISPRQQGR